MHVVGGGPVESGAVGTLTGPPSHHAAETAGRRRIAQSRDPGPWTPGGIRVSTRDVILSVPQDPILNA